MILVIPTLPITKITSGFSESQKVRTITSDFSDSPEITSDFSDSPKITSDSMIFQIADSRNKSITCESLKSLVIFANH